MKLREIVSPAREIERFPCNCGSLPLNAGDLTCMNYVAVVVFTCCAAPISLRVVDSLRHTHAFSRVTLREFLVKWATMAAPMVSENVRFKINFMMYDILTKLNKQYICYNILP